MPSEPVASLGPFLTNRFGDRYLYEVNRSAFDQLGSKAVFQKHFGKALFAENRLFVIAGTDSGLLPAFVSQCGPGVGSRYLFVELPAVLERLQGLDRLPPQVAVTTPDRLGEWLETFQIQNYVYLDAVQVREALCVIDANLPEYSELWEALRDAIGKQVFAIKASLETRGFTIRQIENLADNRVPGGFLRNLFPGKTAVILGGGPSLDEFLPWVKENRHKLAVFAVSRISRQLCDEGVFPDFLFSIDPQEISFSVSRDIFALADTSLLIHAYHVVPRILAQWPGRSVYLGPRFPWPFLLEESNLDSPGPTVTNTALNTAIAMGFSQIVLIGVDLCFSPKGFSHASGSKESQIGPVFNSNIKVTTNDGRLAETNTGYFSAIGTLSEQARRALAAGCRIVTPASGAARIDHVDYLPLDRIRLKPFETPPLERVLAIMPPDDKESRALYFEQLGKELERVKDSLQAIRTLAQEALKCNEMMYRGAARTIAPRYKKRMDAIERELNASFADLVPVIKKFALQEFLKITRPDPSKPWSQAEIEETARTYYNAYCQGAEELLILIDALLKRLESRREEDVPAPDLARLFALWRQEGHPGRIRVFKLRRPDVIARATSGELEQIQALEGEFARLLQAQEVAHKTVLQKRFNRKVLLARARLLFRHRNEMELRQLQERLTSHADKEGATLLESLVRGYVAELSGRQEEAMERYHELIGEDFNPLTEEALKRIAAMSLDAGNSELALMALECLSHGSVTYKPQHAFLLQILGRHQDAADAYVDYLEAVPHDLTVLLKLGQLYRTMGHGDAARQVFGMVLEQDPANQAAQALLMEG